MTRLTSLAIVLLLVVPSLAEAQTEQRVLFGGSAELFASRTLDSDNEPRFGFGGGAALMVEWNALPQLGVQLGGMFALFSANQTSSTEWIGGRGGLRLHWLAFLGNGSDDGWVDAHYAIGGSGGIVRSGFDVGAGYEFAILRGFRLGPFVRFQWMSEPRGDDATFLSFGLSIGLLGDPRLDSVMPDHDHDTVADTEDICPDVPQGASPDESRRGCPARDTDDDSVPDFRDQCVNEPQGARPDPQRPGCPGSDQDVDGVDDFLDQCPTVPQGSTADPARPGCPASDRDNDGVADPVDQCPDQHPGRHPDPARPGCRLPDRDDDTVVDPEDACPDQAGAPSLDPRRNGCPGLIRIQGGQVRILQPVYFATNRETILEASFPVLVALSDALQASGIDRIRIEGHTDDRGDDAANLELSRRRAQSVLDWLASHGVPGERLEAVGLGESRPIEDNGTELGRAGNRRVEFHIVVDQDDPEAAERATP